MEVRELRANEREVWLGLRERLWPEMTREELVREQEEIVADPERNSVFVAERNGAGVVGFVEVAIRQWAEGCRTQPVGYIEAWYVEPGHRRGGVGRRLIEAAERWAEGRGCTEMGSDAVVGNEVSRDGHLALGYTEVVRLVLFSKRIGG